MEAVIFAGIQGSGKTTFYRERFFRTHVRISLDLLRTRRREAAFLRTCLETRQPFVVDNTNPTAAERAAYIGAARAAGFRVVGYFFDADLGDAIRRNRAREGKERIPPVGIGATRQRLQPPRLEEGFDALFTVRIAPGGGFAVEEAGGRSVTENPPPPVVS